MIVIIRGSTLNVHDDGTIQRKLISGRWKEIKIKRITTRDIMLF